MEKILFLTLVHPDFLPPVYASAQVLAEKGYEISIYTFESTAPEIFNTGEKITVDIVAKNKGSFIQRIKGRNEYSKRVKKYIEDNKPVFIISFCEFSYLTALKYSNGIPVFYFVLELVDFSYLNLFKSPLGALRNLKAT